MISMAIWNPVAEEATDQVGWPGGRQQLNKHKLNYLYNLLSRSMRVILLAVVGLFIN